MECQLSQVGWRGEFFPAVRPQDAGNFQSIGVRGCFLSHLEVLKSAKRTGAERLIIIEDDLDFVRDFKHCWHMAMDALENKRWSIFYPGHCIKDFSPGLSLLPHDQSVLCAHFVMFNSEALSTVIEGLETIKSRPRGHPAGGPMPVDGAYSIVRKTNPELKTYLFSPSLGYQRASRSDIADVNWFDRVEAWRAPLELARALKRGLRRMR